MKKFLLCMTCLVGLIAATLSFSSCGFTSSGGLEIEQITAEMLNDGSGATRITIKYFDDTEEPLIFDIPMGLEGEQGAAGEEGVGIKRIDISNSDDGQKQTMTIVYTDPDREPTKVEVKNGIHIVSTDRVDEEGGASYLRIKFSDGSENKVLLPEGAPGPGIASLIQRVDPDTNQTIVQFMLDNGESLTPITIQPGVRGKTIDRVVTEDWVEEGKKLGLTLKFYLEDSTQPLASVNLREGVGLGDIVSEPIMIGDKKVGTKFYFEKSDGSVTDEIEVMDGVGVVDIQSEVRSDGSTKVIVYLSDGTTKDFIVPAAVSISKIESSLNESGDTVLKIVMTDDTFVQFTLKKAVGIQNIGISNSSDNSGYVMTIYYSDGTQQSIPFDKPTAWLNGWNAPSSSQGKEGDYYFDQANSIIYHKVGGVWQKVVDFYEFGESATVTFAISPALGESWDASSATYIQTPTYSLEMRVGEAFYSNDNNYSIPTPVRTPTAADIESGITAWHFLGWSTTRTPSQTNGFFTDLTMISGSITLVPVWQAIY